MQRTWNDVLGVLPEEAMSPEQLDRIDALCAEKVMGWELETQSGGVRGARDAAGRFYVMTRGAYENFHNYWSPTRDGNAAMEVFVAMKDREPLLRPDGKMWMCIMDASADPNDTKTTWHDHRSYTVHRRRVDEHDADPRVVICLTALKALGVEVPR